MKFIFVMISLSIMHQLSSVETHKVESLIDSLSHWATVEKKNLKVRGKFFLHDPTKPESIRINIRNSINDILENSKKVKVIIPEEHPQVRIQEELEPISQIEAQEEAKKTQEEQERIAQIQGKKTQEEQERIAQIQVEDETKKTQDKIAVKNYLQKLRIKKMCRQIYMRKKALSNIKKTMDNPYIIHENEHENDQDIFHEDKFQVKVMNNDEGHDGPTENLPVDIQNYMPEDKMAILERTIYYKEEDETYLEYEMIDWPFSIDKDLLKFILEMVIVPIALVYITLQIMPQALADRLFYFCHFKFRNLENISNFEESSELAISNRQIMDSQFMDSQFIDNSPLDKTDWNDIGSPINKPNMLEQISRSDKSLFFEESELAYSLKEESYKNLENTDMIIFPGYVRPNARIWIINKTPIF